MKSVIASGIAIASLIQGLAHAQVFDLPEPGAGVNTAENSAEDQTSSGVSAEESSYAASLRLGAMSRKEEGTLYRILLEPTRLRRIDTRVAFGKIRLREAWLLTESGVRFEVQKYRATGVQEMSSLYSSENFSLNENIVEIHLSAEAFSDNAELILTAVSDNAIPKLKPWQAPVVVQPAMPPGFSRESMESSASACARDFCVGDVVIYQRQRAKVVQVMGQGQVVVLQRGVRKVVFVKALKRPSIPPYRG